MGGWADVPDNDRGNLRCRRAVDISSYFGVYYNTKSPWSNPEGYG